MISGARKIREWMKHSVERVSDRFEKTKRDPWHLRVASIVETIMDIIDDCVDETWELPIVKRNKRLIDTVAYYSIYLGLILGAFASCMIVYYYYTDKYFQRDIDSLHPLVHKIIIISIAAIFGMGVSILHMHEHLENEYLEHMQHRAGVDGEFFGGFDWNDYIDPARIGRPPYEGDDSWWDWIYQEDLPPRPSRWFNEHLGSRNQLRKARTASNAGVIGMRRMSRTKRAVQPHRMRKGRGRGLGVGGCDENDEDISAAAVLLE